MNSEILLAAFKWACTHNDNNMIIDVLNRFDINTPLLVVEECKNHVKNFHKTIDHEIIIYAERIYNQIKFCHDSEDKDVAQYLITKNIKLVNKTAEDYIVDVYGTYQGYLSQTDAKNVLYLTTNYVDLLHYIDFERLACDICKSINDDRELIMINDIIYELKTTHL